MDSYDIEILNVMHIINIFKVTQIFFSFEQTNLSTNGLNVYYCLIYLDRRYKEGRKCFI